jgi:tRNA nucleotidyltransferase (CCA-adding enzyme)
VEWTLGRLYELGVARKVHPKLATGARTIGLVKKMDDLVAELELTGEVVSWRLRLSAITRNMSHDELYLWLDKLKLKRSDSAIVRAAVVVGPLLASRLEKEHMSDWDIFQTLRSTPVEALVFALAGMEEGPARTRIRRYLAEIRHRTLSVSGDDLLALGMKKGPRVGRVLERLRQLRVEEVVNSREGELEAARQMVSETG